jgi:hypothetical protein
MTANNALSSFVQRKCQSKHMVDRLNPQPEWLRHLISKFSGGQSWFLSPGRLLPVCFSFSPNVDGHTSLLSLGVFRLGLLQKGNFRVGLFPPREEVFHSKTKRSRLKVSWDSITKDISRLRGEDCSTNVSLTYPMRKKGGHRPPLWDVMRHGVMRRAIRLKVLPVQNRSPRTRRTLPLLTVPKRLSVFGC